MTLHVSGHAWPIGRMKIYSLFVCVGLTLGACKGEAGLSGEPGVAADGVKPEVTEAEYTPDDNRARVLLKVAPGATVTAKSAVGQWAFESMTSESGGAQFNVTLRDALQPGQALTLTFEVSKDGKSEMIEAVVKAGGAKPLDVHLGFAPSEPSADKRRVGCRPGALVHGTGDKAKNVAAFCGVNDTMSYFLDKGETKVKLLATSKDLTSITVAGVKADFVDGKAELAVDPAAAIATSSALAMVGYEGQISLSLEAEGPGGPFWGDLPLETGGDTAKGWMLAVAKGPSLLPNERQRPPRRGLMAAIRTNEATGGLLYGLFVKGLKEETNYRIKAQEIDLVAIDSGAAKVVGNCKYAGADGAKTDRDQINIASNITVYDRKTGAKVASKVFEPGKHPGCAAEIMAGDGNFVNKADLFAIEEWAKTLLTDDFVPGVDDEVAAPAADLGALVVDDTALARIDKQAFGFSRHATAAQVEKVLGPPTETQPDDVENKMRVRVYLGGAISVGFGLPGDTANLIIAGGEDLATKLAERGIKDPLGDLSNQKLDVAGKLLGKPKKSVDDTHDWSFGGDRAYTDLSLTYFDGRCTTITLMWITVQAQ